jgi:NAD(P)-dependent dehydrogenase (short-subunit alcohol dehydrogenase family)
LGGCFYCCAAVAPIMIAQSAGKIVNVSSTTFWSPAPQLAHYVTTKAGIIGLTRALSRELGRYGINVNAIAPGFTRTDATAYYPPEQFERSAAARAIPRIEEREDLVGTVLYLCSPASDFVTGQVIVVDGGGTFD